MTIVQKFLVLGLGLALLACSETESAAPAAPHATVRTGDYFQPILNMDIDFGNAARSGAMLAVAGDEVLAIGKAMISGKPPVAGAIDAINFTVLGTAGADATVGRKLAHFTMSAQELRQLAHAGANGQTVLDSARDIGTWSPTNDDVVKDYCSHRSTSGFCVAAMGG